MELSRHITNIPLFSNISTKTLEHLLTISQIRSYEKKHVLFIDGHTVNKIYFLITGVASIYKESAFEKKVIFICGTYSCLNLINVIDSKTSASVELLSDSTLIEFRRKDFCNICFSDEILTKNITVDMSTDIKRLYRQLRNTPNALNLDKKIASKLWKLARDFGVKTSIGHEINFDLTISYLASMLGSKRETVSRNVKTLAQHHLIIHTNNRFTVIDMKKLAAYFNE